MFKENLKPQFAFIGVPAAVTLKGGTVRSACVLFDESGTEGDVVTLEPTVRALREEWPDIAPGDAVAIAFPAGTRTFTVRRVLPEGDGAVQLVNLARA